MKTIQRVFLLLSLIVLASTAWAQAPRAIRMPDPRAAAMGGRHVALADDIGVLFSNPAGFAAQRSILNISGLAAQASGPVFDIAGLLISGSAADPNAIIGLFDETSRLYTKADIGGPIAFGYVGDGLGFGFFNRSLMEVNAASLVQIDVEAGEEILLVGGYAHRFKMSKALSLDLGVMPKGFIRLEIPYSTNILGLSAVIQNLPVLLDMAPFSMTTGIGLDAGMRFSVLDVFTFAVAAQDAYTPTFSSLYSSFNAFRATPNAALLSGPVMGLVPCDLSAGFYINPPLGRLGRYISSMEFMLDYSDILSLWSLMPPNPLLLFSAGTEVTLHDIFHIRGGWNQGTFAAGFGMDLTLFSLDIAMFGSELGRDLGDRTEYNLMIGLNFDLM